MYKNQSQAKQNCIKIFIFGVLCVMLENIFTGKRIVKGIFDTKYENI